MGQDIPIMVLLGFMIKPVHFIEAQNQLIFIVHSLPLSNLSPEGSVSSALVTVFLCKIFYQLFISLNLRLFLPIDNSE